MLFCIWTRQAFLNLDNTEDDYLFSGQFLLLTNYSTGQIHNCILALFPSSFSHTVLCTTNSHCIHNHYSIPLIALVMFSSFKGHHLSFFRLESIHLAWQLYSHISPYFINPTHKFIKSLLIQSSLSLVTDYSTICSKALHTIVVR